MAKNLKAASQVLGIYHKVIADVGQKMKQEFLDEGTDEEVLEEMCKRWMEHLLEMKVVVTSTTSGAGAAYSESSRRKTGVNQVDGVDDCDEDDDDDGDVSKTNNDAVDGNIESHRATSLLSGLTEPIAAAAASEATSEAAATLESTAAAAALPPPPPSETVASAPDGRIAEGEPCPVAAVGRHDASSRPSRLRQVDGSDDEFISDDASLSADDDEEQSAEDENDNEHYMICQFEKIGRVKKRWKATLKDGIIRINGVDVMFSKAMGEWEW